MFKLLSLLLVTFSLSLAHANTEGFRFGRIIEKSHDAMEETQRQILLEAQALIIEFEKHENPDKQISYLEFILMSAHASGNLVTCVHNGWVAKMEKKDCDRATKWSFDVTSDLNPLWKGLTTDLPFVTNPARTKCANPDGNVSISKRLQPCPISYGLTKNGGLFCGKGTRSCENASSAGNGLGNLAQVITGCDSGSATGEIKSDCEGLKKSLKTEMDNLSENCKKAKKSLKSLCGRSHARMKQMLDKDGKVREEYLANGDTPEEMPKTCHYNDFKRKNGRAMKEIECMFCSMIYETGVAKKNRDDRAAVSYSMMNRVVDKEWGNNICSVVYQKSQYAWTTLGKSRLKKKMQRNPIGSGRVWREAQDQFKIYQSHMCSNIDKVQPTYGKKAMCSNHFHASYSYPAWRKRFRHNRKAIYSSAGKATHHHYRGSACSKNRRKGRKRYCTAWRGKVDDCLFEKSTPKAQARNSRVNRNPASDSGQRCNTSTGMDTLLAGGEI